MNILGFNPGHHSSICLLQDGEIKYFIQEERLSRFKYDHTPFKTFIDILQRYPIDVITWGTPSKLYPLEVPSHSSMYFHEDDIVPYWYFLAKKYNPKSKYVDFSNNHHITHTAHSFYNSGFKKCISLVIDGIGSFFQGNFETESIYECSYPSTFTPLYKNHTSDWFKEVNLSRAYEGITMHLGWSKNEAGKTMGLAPYGKQNHNFPSFFINKKGNPDVFYTDFNREKETIIDEEKSPQLKLSRDPKEWHYDKSKISNLEKDLAWKIQNDTQQLVGDYIEEIIQKTGLTQICCAGGYFLNCVTNYYLLKRFPNIEFYFEPIANDAGTAIGAAKLVWHESTNDKTIRPFKSLYLGKKYLEKKLLKGIKKYT